VNSELVVIVSELLGKERREGGENGGGEEEERNEESRKEVDRERGRGKEEGNLVHRDDHALTSHISHLTADR